MARLKNIVALSGLLLGSVAVAATAASTSSVIPDWHIQSTLKITTEPAALSRPGLDTSEWTHVNASRCTLMGCLIQSGMYSEEELFLSDNLRSVDSDQFLVPWLYRNEFLLDPAEGKHFFLETNGITSRADVFLNGKQLADKAFQSGAYGGRTYDISSVVDGVNALVFKVYPTDYMHDFAIGFVDWNPAPPDNGTGIWRDVTVKQTGPVSLGPLRAVTTFDKPVGQGGAVVALKATVQNLENKTATVDVEGIVSKEGTSGEPVSLKKSLTLQPLASDEINIKISLDDAAIWWPKQWGGQPLYKGQISVSVNGSLSDSEERKFGLRQVTHQLNSYNDSIFSVNGHPFQVLGAGYTSDIFLRWDSAKFTAQAQYMLEMGLNTIRLEGKMEHPEFYDIADRLGLMVMAGWECCDKWEAWSYNDNLDDPIPIWDDNDYNTANASMWHEAHMLQTHPSILTFLVGSDFWPNDRAAAIYIDALAAADWQTPIIPYAAKKDGYPEALGPPSLKMEGPYDWVPPNYWYDTKPAEERLGAAFGFGSELGPGVGTPELSSLKRFLSKGEQDDLWKSPNKSLLHMSPSNSDFSTRTIYNGGLWNRYGAPTSLDDYLIKAQIMDYEATRAEFEGYSAFWNNERPATGAIYWMLNGAWPNLHWSLFDYYLHPAGAYFGTKVAGRVEHVAYDYVNKFAYLINHSLDRSGSRSVAVDVIELDGKALSSNVVRASTEPNTSKRIADLTTALGAAVEGVVFLRLVLKNDEDNSTLSRNVYWLAETTDTVDWPASDWFYTPVSEFADFTALDRLAAADVSVTAEPAAGGDGKWKVVLENRAEVPAFFVRLNLVDGGGADVVPVFWSDNYVTLWPGETLELEVGGGGGAAAIQVSGKNVAKAEVGLT